MADDRDDDDDLAFDPIAGTFAELQMNPTVVCIRFTDADEARRAAKAAIDGGLLTIEVTLTTPDALDIIRELVEDGRALIGAGTVLGAGDAQSVKDAGGRFTMGPNVDQDVLEVAQDLGLLHVPGAATPTEVIRAYQGGAKVVKLFPIGLLGGVQYVRTLRGPLPDVPLLPANGVTLDNMGEYFQAGAMAVGIGGPDLFGDGVQDDDAAERVAQRASQYARAVRVALAARSALNR